MEDRQVSCMVDGNVRREFDIARANKGGIKLREAVEEALAAWTTAANLGASTNSVTHASSELATKIPPERAIPRTPSTIAESVLQILGDYWHDPRCRECVLAIGKVFGLSDIDLIKAFTNDCVRFGRLAAAVGETRAKYGKQQGAGASEREHPKTRVERLMEDARKHSPRDVAHKKMPGAPRGSQ